MRQTLALLSLFVWLSCAAAACAQSVAEVIESDPGAQPAPVKAATPDKKSAAQALPPAAASGSIPEPKARAASEPVSDNAPPPPETPDADKLNIDEPGFKATAKLPVAPPEPVAGADAHPSATAAPEKPKEWSVPQEEGAPPPETQRAASDDGDEKENEEFSPLLAKAVAKEKKGGKNTKELVRIFEEVVAAEAQNAPARYRLGLALVRNGDLTRGAKELDTARTLKPENPKYQCDFGLAALRLGWMERALEACQRAAFAVPSEARFQSAVGDCQLAMRAFNKALTAYASAIALDKGRNADYIYNLGMTYLHAEAFKKAIEIFDEAIRVRKDAPLYYCSRGLAHENLKEIRQAIMDYSTAVKVDKNCAYAHFLLAGAYSDPDDPTYTNKFDAVEHAQLAVKLSGAKNAQYLIGFARALRVARRYDEAVQVAKQAVELDSRGEYKQELAKLEKILREGW